MRGNIALNGVLLDTGDGASVEVPGEYEVSASEDTEGLLFDLS